MLSENAKDFVLKVLNKNPSERITADECLKHPWLLETQSTSTPREVQNINEVTNNLN
jgi:serine/threonine protein kinase